MSAIGINLSGAEYAWGSLPGASQLDLLQKEGIDLVRLPISWERLQPSLDGGLDGNYLQQIENFLDAAAARQIKVVVDLHNFGRYDTNYASDYVRLFTDSALTTPVTASSAGSYVLTVTAAGASAGGVWPTLQLSIDGTPVDSATVASTSLHAYQFAADLTAGTHQVSLGFTNDAVIGEEDRNLYVSELQVSGPSPFAVDLLALNMPGRPADADLATYPSPDNGSILGTSAVPIAALADLWTKLAGALAGNPAVAGYDLMNEPHDMPNTGVWPAAAQAAVDAIRTVDQATAIYVEGDQWAGAASWLQYNANLDINDTTNNIVYEAHVYFDGDASGNYRQTYDQQGATPTIGVSDIAPFLKWLKDTGSKGFIGEMGVPDNDPRWLTVLAKAIAAMQAAGVSGAYWNWAYHSPADPVWWLPADGPLSAIAADGDSAHGQLGVLFARLAPAIVSCAFVPDTTSTGGGDQLSVSGSAVVACTVGIFDGGTLIGTTTAGSDGTWSFIAPATTGRAATHSITADMIDPFGNQSGLSKPVVVDEGGGTGVPSGNMIVGTAGNDVVNASRTVAGQPTPTAYADVIVGMAGNDALAGLAGDDRINGNGGNDLLIGGPGSDNLNGGSGADRLAGGPGNDSLTGGPGADRFLFDSALDGTTNVDTITDFSPVADVVWLQNAVFTALHHTGPLAPALFHRGAAAADLSDRIVYTPQTGFLFYDADGSRAGAAVHFATLAPHLAVTAADFFVV